MKPTEQPLPLQVSGMERQFLQAGWTHMDWTCLRASGSISVRGRKMRPRRVLLLVLVVVVLSSSSFAGNKDGDDGQQQQVLLLAKMSVYLSLEATTVVCSVIGIAEEEDGVAKDEMGGIVYIFLMMTREKNEKRKKRLGIFF